MKNSISKSLSFSTDAFDSIGNRETHADGGGTPVSYTANGLNPQETETSYCCMI